MRRQAPGFVDNFSMIMHIDMNSFFASVEQQMRPELRGKPVVVLAYNSAKGVVLASSVEAKRDFKIKTGMTLAEARQRCPWVEAVESSFGPYKTYSAAFMKLCRQYSHLVEQYSVDEAFINIDWSARTWDQAQELACEIKQRLRTEVGERITASIGVAPTRFLAKLAGDSMKPDGLVILRPQDLPQWYVGRDIESAWGIGPGIARKLRKMGINTLYELYHRPMYDLVQQFGRSGYVLWSKLRAVETDSLQTDRATDQKSISAQYSLPFRTTDVEELRPVLMKMCERVGRRLRRQSKEAGRVFCFWRCLGGGGDSLHENILPKTTDSFAIFEAVMRMISTKKVPYPYRLLGVGVSRLSRDGGQQSLFVEQKTEHITAAMDSLNDVYGEYTVFRGAMMGAKRFAKEAIGFRKIT